MSARTESAVPAKVYTTEEKQAAIGQPNHSVGFSDEQILAVISELHVCYDYCAAWKESDVAVDVSIGTGTATKDC